MNNVLVIDDMAVFRVPIALALRQRGFDARAAEDGLDALRQMNQTMPDLILLDLAMPGMDGLALLRTIRTQHRFDDVAVILLTAISDRSKIIEAGNLGVRDYLLKSRFCLDELCTRIRKYTAPSVPTTELPQDQSASTVSHTDAPPPVDPTEALKDVKPILSRSEVTEQIEAAAELKAMSPIVGKILKLTGSANCSIQQVANTIRQDQAMALKVLKLANSSVYTRGEQVESVQQAVTRIGLKHIREVALNISVMDSFANPDIAAILDTNDFWEHSIATGLIAANLTRCQNGSDTEINAAFTMGLLHDVGRMVFVEQFSDAYLKVIDTAEQLSLPLEQVESRMLLVNHADLMDKLLHLWHFSKTLTDPIALHHLSITNARGLAPRTVKEVAVLSLANRIAHAMLLGTSGNNTIYPVKDLIDFLQLQDEQTLELEQGIAEQVQDMKFTMLSSNTLAQQHVELRQRIQQQFSTPLRPLYISTQTGFDAYRAFTTALGEPSDEGPNIAIVHLNTPSDRVKASQLLLDAEAEAECDPLPTILLSRKGAILLENEAMSGRSHRLVTTPTPISQFVHHANKLLGGNAQAEAA